MSDDSVVPEAWVETTLGALGRYLNGRAFKSSEWGKVGRPIIRIQDLTGSNRNPNFFDGDVADRYIVRPGDFLISWSATLGAYIWDGPEAVLNQHIFKVESNINKKFHYHLVRERIAELERNAHGSGMVHVTKGIFDDTAVSIPGDEGVQEQIANLIDSIEAKQQSSMQHFASASRAIERFRTAVLAAAYADAEVGSDEVTRLGEILREPLKNGYSARPVNHDTPYRVLTLTATTSGWFNGDHFKYTDEEFLPDSPFWLTSGDIVVQRGNTAEYVGVPALYEGPPGKYLYPDLMIRVRVAAEIAPRFLWYMLLAPQARNFLRDRATGSAGNMPKINQKVLAEVPVPLPDQEARTQLVQKLDDAFKFAGAVQQHIKTATGRVDRSPHAVLAKAFRGDLTADAEVAP